MYKKFTIRPTDIPENTRRWTRISRVLLMIMVGQMVLFTLIYFVSKANFPDPERFSQFQGGLSKGLVIVLFLEILGLLFFFRKEVKGAFAAYFYQPTSPYSLAIMRFSVMFLVAAHLLFYVIPKYGPLTLLPSSSLEGLPGIGWLIHALPISHGLYLAMAYIGVGLSILVGMGLFTRWTFPAVCLVLLYVLGVPLFYGKVYHYHFFLWAPVFLAFSPCADVFSVDAWLKKRRGEIISTEPAYRYGIAMKFVFLQIGVIYFFSAIGKLWFTGLEWALSDNLIYLMRLEWLEQNGQVPFIRLDNFPVLCRLLGMGVIIFELSYFWLILHPSTRVATGIAAIFFHLSNGYFLSIDFRFLQYLNGFHIDWAGLYDRLKPISNNLGFIALSVLISIGIGYWQVFLGLGVFILLMHRRFKTIGERNTSTPTTFPKWAWRISILFLGMNFLMGATQTSSWPFSTYPSYSFIRGPHIKYVNFQPFHDSGIRMNLDSLNIAHQFKKEGILPLAEEAANYYEPRDSSALSNSIQKFWIRYQELVPPLKQVDSAWVMFQVFSTNPDKYDHPLQETKIGKMLPGSEGWQWYPE